MILFLYVAFALLLQVVGLITLTLMARMRCSSDLRQRCASHHAFIALRLVCLLVVASFVVTMLNARILRQATLPLLLELLLLLPFSALVAWFVYLCSWLLLRNTKTDVALPKLNGRTFVREALWLLAGVCMFVAMHLILNVHSGPYDQASALALAKQESAQHCQKNHLDYNPLVLTNTYTDGSQNRRFIFVEDNQGRSKIGYFLWVVASLEGVVTSKATRETILVPPIHYKGE